MTIAFKLYDACLHTYTYKYCIGFSVVYFSVCVYEYPYSIALYIITYEGENKL